LSGEYVAAVLADAPTHYWRPALYPYGAVFMPSLGSVPNALTFEAGSAFEGWTGPADDGVSSAFLIGGRYRSDEQQALTSQFTFEAWIFVRKRDLGAAGAVFAWDGDAANTPSIVVQANNLVRVSAEGVDCISVNVLAPYVWTHVVGTRSTTQLDIYLNGAHENTQSVGAQSISSKFMSAGATASGAVPYKAWMSELAIYNTVLTSGQVGAHYAAAANKASFPTPPFVPGVGGSSIFTVTYANSAQLLADSALILASVRASY
jgi:hypothetical protein